MSNLFEDWDTQLNLIKTLEQYEIELGLFKDGEYIRVGVLHGDGSKTEYQIPVEDIVYMSEYGTISFPGTHMLQYLFYWIETQFTERLEKIWDGVFERHWTETNIETEMNSFELFINGFIQSYISSQIKEMTFLADKTNQKGLIDFPIDLSLLKNYILCKIFKKV